MDPVFSKSLPFKLRFVSFQFCFLIGQPFRTPLVIRRNKIENQPQNEISRSRKTNQKVKRDHKGHRHRTTANGRQRTAMTAIKITAVSATATDQWFMSDRLYMKRFIICNQKSNDKIEWMTHGYESLEEKCVRNKCEHENGMVKS